MATALTDTQPARPKRRRQLSQPAIDLIAGRLRVIGEPTRIQILGLLNDGDATVQELTDSLPTTHQNVSKHLAALHGEGMVSRRRDGTRVYYSLIDWTGWWLVEQIGASVTARLDELRQAFDNDDEGGP